MTKTISMRLDPVTLAMLTEMGRVYREPNTDIAKQAIHHLYNRRVGTIDYERLYEKGIKLMESKKADR